MLVLNDKPFVVNDKSLIEKKIDNGEYVGRKQWKLDNSKRIKVKFEYFKKKVDYLANLPINLVASMSRLNDFYLPIDIAMHPTDIIQEQEQSKDSNLTEYLDDKDDYFQNSSSGQDDGMLPNSISFKQQENQNLTILNTDPDSQDSSLVKGNSKYQKPNLKTRKLFNQSNSATKYSYKERSKTSNDSQKYNKRGSKLQDFNPQQENAIKNDLSSVFENKVDGLHSNFSQYNDKVKEKIDEASPKSNLMPILEEEEKFKVFDQVLEEYKNTPSFHNRVDFVETSLKVEGIEIETPVFGNVLEFKKDKNQQVVDDMPQSNNLLQKDISTQYFAKNHFPSLVFDDEKLLKNLSNSELAQANFQSNKHKFKHAQSMIFPSKDVKLNKAEMEKKMREQMNDKRRAKQLETKLKVIQNQKLKVSKDAYDEQLKSMHKSIFTKFSHLYILNNIFKIDIFRIQSQKSISIEVFTSFERVPNIFPKYDSV